MFKKLNQTTAYNSIFSNLWYSTLPCFDTKGMTANKDGERSVLKYCEWKGMQIPCSAIFTTFPSDQGMCCSFNIKAAEDIFQGQTYPQIVTQLQQEDKNSSFRDNTLPKAYLDNQEPTTLPGRNKGLVLMIDAHTNLFAASSVNSDYQGFMGLISSSGSFPFIMQEGFEIRPGHNNIIALSGSQVIADDSLRGLSVQDRQCQFSDENQDMKIHNDYTYYNCMFECSLLYAQSQLQIQNNSTYACIPWFFPSPDPFITICDPWESVGFFNFMINNIPDETCSHCLPDCSTTIYDTSITTIPFSRCGSSNLGTSRLCNLDDPNLPRPTKFGNQIIKEYQVKQTSLPPFVANIESSQRNISSEILNGDIFSQDVITYDAYDIDIAAVQIYFKKSTMFQWGSQPSMTWIDYFSAVGGLLGLVLGMGIVSAVEIFWLFLRLVAQKLQLTEWIA